MSHAALHATACIGCRRRGRKCDRTLPSCLSCENRGVACEGYVTKWPGVAARGKLAGKSIPVADSSVTITKTKSTSRVRQKQIKQDISARQGNSDRQNTLSSRFSFIPDEVDEFVQHYIADLSSIFFLGNGPSENPMFHYVLPLINTVPPIRFALAGSASCHIAARNSDEALERKSLRLRVHATHLLREMLQSPIKATDQVILASILMLAQLDMCSGDCNEFRTHLKAAASVIRNQDYDGAVNKYYFEQRLAWLDIMSSTTSTKQPNLVLEEVKTIIGRFSTNGVRQWSYDVFPCPIDLFEIIIEITFLFKSQGRPSSDTLQAKVTHLRDRLRDWKCPFMLGPRKHMVEAWRLGIMAYIQRIFPHTGSEAQAKLSSQVLDLAEQIPPASSWSYALLWPIFQAAVTLDDDAVDEKDTIRKRLRIALEAIGCRHHSNALEALEVVWGRREVFDPSTISIPGRTIMLV
ncbi:fungal-specific transcription factor domain-containing protein [Fusarium avenaceum]|nr:fungal-specific transcription factor domain-containing protein [Fusarium avenaceum]